MFMSKMACTYKGDAIYFSLVLSRLASSYMQKVAAPNNILSPLVAAIYSLECVILNIFNIRLIVIKLIKRVMFLKHVSSFSRSSI